MSFRRKIDIKRLDTLGKFSTILYKKDNFCEFLFGFVNAKTLLYRSPLKRKEFALNGSTFFL